MSNSMWGFLLQCVIILAALQPESCSVVCPPPPVLCTTSHSESCHLTNYRGVWEDEKSCKVAKAFFPKTEAELINAVAYAVKEGRKIKVISGGSHSLNRFVCPEGESGVVISTHDYSSRIIVDEKSMTVTADAGVTLRKLINTLAAKGLAFPQTTDWDGLSVARVISTAAHGSGIWGKGGAIHEYVVGMSLVVPAPAHQGYAKLIVLTENDEAIKAARVSLGVLGAISQVTFAVEKIFKRSVSIYLKDDKDLEDSFIRFARNHELGLITWYPSFRRVVYTLADRVAVDVPGNGTISNFAFRPATVQSIVQNRLTEEENYAREKASKICNTSKAQVEQGVKTGNGYLNDGKTFRGYPVVGYNHLMQSSSGCQIDPRSVDDFCPWEKTQIRSNDTTCSWNTRIKGNFYFHTSISVPLLKIAEVITDIKRLRDLDPIAMCDIDNYLGVNMRYFKKSEDYLSRGEDSVDVEFMSLRYRKEGVPRWNGHVMEEMEQMLLQKYGGLPHWGKNRVYTFEGAAQRTKNLVKFLEVKEMMDLAGFFSSKWSDGVLGIGKGVEIFRDGCALDGLCVCKEDRHCAPEKGFFCKPGILWKQARVCIQQ